MNEQKAIAAIDGLSKIAEERKYKSIAIETEDGFNIENKIGENSDTIIVKKDGEEQFSVYKPKGEYLEIVKELGMTII